MQHSRLRPIQFAGERSSAAVSELFLAGKEKAIVQVDLPRLCHPILPTCEPTVLIGFQPAARVTDKATCVGPPDVIAKGSPTVIVGNQMQARIGDPTVHGGVITTGFPTVIVGEVGMGRPVTVDPAPPAAAFKNAAKNGTPLICKGTCEACGQM